MTKFSGYCLASVFFLAALSTQAYATKLYKWVDEKGVTHYGETPPDLDTATKLNIKTGASSDQADAMEKLEAERKARSEAKAKLPTTNEEVEAKNREIMKRNCEIQKRNLGQLTANRRIKETDDSGNVRYLTEDDIASRTKEIRTYLQENCSGNH